MHKCFLLLILIILASCSTGKIATKNTEEILKSIKVVGEGRGRLNLDQQNHVFSYEALLKDKKDWILAAAIPLHGEEVLIFHDIKKLKSKVISEQSLEKRIQNKHFILGARSLIRFLLADQLNLKRVCRQNVCQVMDQTFDIKLSDKFIKISYKLEDHVFELTAENLTGPFFGRTNFYLKHANKHVPIMSLELFWK